MFQIVLTIFLAFSAFSTTAYSQASADDVLGEWISEEKDSRIEIYKSGKSYSGKLIWAEDMMENDGKTVRKDIRNREEQLQTRSLQNIDVLADFVFEDGIWDDGKMYDPKSGKTYSCILRLRKQLLEVRSYIGFPLFGRSTYWKKALKDAL